ncbi:PREDICTED: metaxin-1-like [Dinoponera quadriceps]|uniref:Metaxin-1-like n=1 Tax=Dinoponera quadriceps TaxID=609295 RepID=A0A6P3WX20_DINQU|nr:PREDICTED: metaxin-1-like [Dinoponera quadriceps]
MGKPKVLGPEYVDVVGKPILYQMTHVSSVKAFDYRRSSVILRTQYYLLGHFEVIHAYYKHLTCLNVNNDLPLKSNEVYSEAQKCLTLLSTRLGDRDFFYGQQPSKIDAIIYSYLAPLLKAPLPNPVLQNHLKACTNLVKYVSRISQRYFKNEYQNYEKHQAEEKAARLKRDTDNEFPNKRRNQFFAAFIATLAMTAYALSAGIVEVFSNRGSNIITSTGFQM